MGRLLLKIKKKCIVCCKIVLAFASAVGRDIQETHRGHRFFGNWKRRCVKKRLWWASALGAQAYNTVAVPQKEGISGVAVLTESPTTGLWAALSYRDAFEGKDQAFSTQHHPEIPVGTDYPTREPGKDFTVNFGGEIVQVSGNLSSGQRALVDYASRLWELGKKAGMTVEDVLALIVRQIANPTLGR